MTWNALLIDLLPGEKSSCYNLKGVFLRHNGAPVLVKTRAKTVDKMVLGI